MVNGFISWFKRNENKFIQAGLSEVDRYENLSDKANDGSIVITEENDNHICQLTVRNDGFIDIEAVSKDSGELEYYIYCKTNKNVDFDNLFSNLFDYLSM